MDWSFTQSAGSSEFTDNLTSRSEITADNWLVEAAWNARPTLAKGGLLVSPVWRTYPQVEHRYRGMCTPALLK